MDNVKDGTPKCNPCYCARCFHFVAPDDKVEVEGKIFHKFCSMCCICSKIPSSVKLFYGHVFCADCFKSHVLDHFQDGQKVNSTSFWMQWAPWSGRFNGQHHQHDKPHETASTSESSLKKEMCTRCAKVIDEDVVVIDGHSFHAACAQCCRCLKVPRDSGKLYYNQVFCEDCFRAHVLRNNSDNPSEFFRYCFDQFEKNSAFAENMKNMMSSSKNEKRRANGKPFIFVSPFCNKNCEGGAPWFTTECGEPKKSQDTCSFSLPTAADNLSTWDFTLKGSTTSTSLISDLTFYDDDDINEMKVVKINFMEKIEKLSKFLHKSNETAADYDYKNWKNYDDYSNTDLPGGWVDLQALSDKTSKRNGSDPGVACPKCLWQSNHMIV